MKPRSILRLVAPSGPFDVDGFKAGVSWLGEHFEVRMRDDILKRDGYLAGDDKRRLEELNEALGDTEADAIVCTRGGYGAMRILPHLDLGRIAEANKPIVGFSDITALHMLWARAGVPSIHASMVASLGKEPAHRPYWLSALGGHFEALDELAQLRPGSGRGRLLGGNLSIVSALAEGPFAPSFEGAVLFLEDVGERAYRIDRLLTSLRLRGVLDGLAGVLLGRFTRCHESEDVSTERVLREAFQEAPYPVFAGAPCGHETTNTPLHVGAEVTLMDGRLTYLSAEGQ